MAWLLQLQPSAFSAEYNRFTRTLSISVDGEVPGFAFPFLERETLLGGLKFAAKAYSGGLGDQPPEKPWKYTLREITSLPRLHFNNKTVLIETADGTWAIDINYVPPLNKTGRTASEAAGASDGNTANTLVNKPVDVLLAKDGQATIKAAIPVGEAPGEYSSVSPSFNPEYIGIVNAEVVQGEISWTINWKQSPPAKADPQILEVTTVVGAGAPVGIAFTTIQPYNVYVALTDGSK